MLRLIVALIALTGGAAAEAPRVAADIAPVHSLAARVMQGAGEPDLIVQQGASPHSHRLRPSEAAAIEQAEIVFWTSRGLTPWMPAALDALNGDVLAVELMEADGTTVLPMREDAVFADHGHGHRHDHAHGGPDAHAWLDPRNAALWVGLIADTLASADPGNAVLYRQNAAAAKAEIEAAAAQASGMLSPHQDRRFIVFHDAYQYFEARFGLTAAGAISDGDATDPSAGRIAEIRELAGGGVDCVFTEPLTNTGLIEAAVGAGARVAVIDPLGAELPPGPQLYTDLIRDIAGRMAGCLADTS